MGVQPILDDLNAILVNEKLGLHIAWGRSDHFGGMVGPNQFNGPAIHLDRIFISALMPKIKVKKVNAITHQNTIIPILWNDRYVDDVEAP